MREKKVPELGCELVINGIVNRVTCYDHNSTRRQQL